MWLLVGGGRRGLTVLACVACVLGLMVVVPQAAEAAVSPIANRPVGGVTADALPTVQIDGVVWSQAIVGNTVYAGGSFANARPAGAAPGTDLTPRTDLLAYDLTTGKLITSFNHTLDAQVKSVVASPDGSRIYIGGSFTSVDGQHRYRMAAFDTTTGALDPNFHPTLDATVNSITVTAATVYAGGIFSQANGVARPHLAAFSASTGATLGWAPNADSIVDAVQLTPDDSHVIVGGAFPHMNGVFVGGLTSVDAVTGAAVPFAVNQVVQDWGSGAAILSLSTDGKAIYGTGYLYGTPGNFEGAFSVNPTTGAINWLEDCHGDTYGVYASSTQVYTVSHEHYCGNIGGFPETSSRGAWYRSTAFTLNATGTVQTNGEGSYTNYAGQPSPSLINWFPDLDIGTYTHQNQGPWTVTGTDDYVVEGGEFLHVNGTAQQGLVRFAVPSIAPDKRGPQDTSAATAPALTAASSTAVTASWATNWDQDDDSLTYRLYRSGVTAPVYTTTATSEFWNRPTLTYRDPGLTAGTTYSYYVVASDPSGNSVRSPSVSVTTGGSKPPPPTGTLASDTFTRATTNGWGPADVGGTWAVSPAAAFATGSGAGTMALATPGSVDTASLTGVAATDLTETVDVTANKVATGNGYFLITRSRVRGNSGYVVKLRFLPGGALHLVGSKVINGAETIFGEVNVASVTYAAGTALRLQVGVHTAGTTTTLTGTVWKVGSTQPGKPQLTQTDSDASLRAAGSIALQSYLSGSATNAPVVLTLDNLNAVST